MYDVCVSRKFLNSSTNYYITGLLVWRTHDYLIGCRLWRSWTPSWTMTSQSSTGSRLPGTSSSMLRAPSTSIPSTSIGTIESEKSCTYLSTVLWCLLPNIAALPLSSICFTILHLGNKMELHSQSPQYII